jgi:hypothetical protein
VSRERLAIVLLTLVIVTAMALRVAAISEKSTITHDEAISYLAATGHQGAYEHAIRQQAPPYGVWAPASVWKGFIRPECGACFKQIGYDLAHFDIHPPLYFWLLHLWCLMFGVHVWTGPSLNIIIFFLAALSLFKLAQFLLRDSLGAVFVVFIWALSPAVIPSSLEARQYDLFTLFTILFASQVINCTDYRERLTPKDMASLTVTSAAGTLTHYHFFLIISGCSIFAIVKLFKKNKPLLTTELACIGLGCVVFFLLHPSFYFSFMTEHLEGGTFNLEGLYLRMQIVIASFLGFFVYEGFLLDFYELSTSKPAYAIFAMVIVFSCLLLVFAKIRPRLSYYASRVTSNDVYVLYLFVWIAGTTILLYLAFLSPPHAMGDKYLCAAWPFFGFVLALVLRSFEGSTKLIVISLLSSILVFGSVSALQSYMTEERSQSVDNLVPDYGSAVVDNVHRGVLLPILWNIPSDKRVFVASQKDLLKNRDTWLHTLRSRSLYVSDLSEENYEATRKKRKKLIKFISQEYRVAPVMGENHEVREVFEVQKHATGRG